MTRHWVVAELADAAALQAMLETLRKEGGVGALDTYTESPQPALEPPSGRIGAVAFVGALGALALAPFSVAMALICAPVGAALAVFAALPARPVPFALKGFQLSAVTAQGDVAEKTKARLEALGGKNVTVIIEARK